MGDLGEERDKPLLFVDIDGVISLFGFAPAAPPAGTWMSVDGVPHLISAAASGHLLALARAFDLVWCGGWEGKADEHLAPALCLPVRPPFPPFLPPSVPRSPPSTRRKGTSTGSSGRSSATPADGRWPGSTTRSTT